MKLVSFDGLNHYPLYLVTSSVRETSTPEDGYARYVTVYIPWVKVEGLLKVRYKKIHKGFVRPLRAWQFIEDYDLGE